MQKLGVHLELNGGNLLYFHKPLSNLNHGETIDCGNSGTTIRLLCGLLSGANVAATLIGDESLSRRPMQRIRDPLNNIGAIIRTSANNTSPIVLSKNAGIRAFNHTLQVPSAQVKSALILAALSGSGTSTLTDPFQTRDHTERLLNLPVTGNTIHIDPNESRDFSEGPIPGDVSSAAFFIVFNLFLGKKTLVIRNTLLNPGRMQYLRTLNDMGAGILWHQTGHFNNEPFGDIEINPVPSIIGGEIPASLSASIIDEVPILSVAALFSREGIIFTDVEELKYKESDRLGMIVRNIMALGGEALIKGNNLEIRPLKKKAPLRELETAHDHRIAMAFAIAQLLLYGEIKLSESDSVAISLPEFFILCRGISNG
jgi:3-phosphoshikimate 1-carboxyvinyltransferase